MRASVRMADADEKGAVDQDAVASDGERDEVAYKNAMHENWVKKGKNSYYYARAAWAGAWSRAREALLPAPNAHESAEPERGASAVQPALSGAVCACSPLARQTPAPISARPT